jgi:hypothetical protein
VDKAGEVKTSLAHASWGAPSCPGFLSAVTRGDEALIICGECDHVVYTTPAADLQQTLTRMENSRLTTMPHADFGDPECCGCLDGIIRGDEADIICEECEALIRTVATADLEERSAKWNSRSTSVARSAPIAGK